MFDLVLNAVANIYTKAADHEVHLAAKATENEDYASTAAHMAKAAGLMDYRDHEVLGEPYTDIYEGL